MQLVTHIHESSDTHSLLNNMQLVTRIHESSDNHSLFVNNKKKNKRVTCTSFKIQTEEFRYVYDASYLSFSQSASSRMKILYIKDISIQS